ncbi:33437_t:CDS:1 [Racocetra persica]|uniref:33437_t:CDS:1 n=1 Tax=Racocetra persica TaxID=160502 RepID=A0ACA9PIK0_9GLOM|nr:33437_t:CDS:1 [Racocetra persica]
MQKSQQKIQIIQQGNVYFFYRPKIENQADVQRFFFILNPEKQKKYYLLIVGKKHLPETKKHESYFLLVDKVSADKKALLESLEEKHYQTKTRGERIQPASHDLAEGKYLIVEHQGHTHFCYQITNPAELKKEQREFNLQKEDDYLISVKNPQQPSPPGVGLGEKQKVNYPPEVQKKFADYRFISLRETEFLQEGAEILLTTQGRQNLTERDGYLQNC